MGPIGRSVPRWAAAVAHLCAEEALIPRVPNTSTSAPAPIIIRRSMPRQRPASWLSRQGWTLGRRAARRRRRQPTPLLASPPCWRRVGVVKLGWSGVAGMAAGWREDASYRMGSRGPANAPTNQPPCPPIRSSRMTASRPCLRTRSLRLTSAAPSGSCCTPTQVRGNAVVCSACKCSLGFGRATRCAQWELLHQKTVSHTQCAHPGGSGSRATWEGQKCRTLA